MAYKRLFSSVSNLSDRVVDTFRRSLAYRNALPQLAILAVVIGLAVGLVIAAFRMIIDAALSGLLEGEVDNFEQLDLLTRSVLIAVGTLLLISLMGRIKGHRREMSVAHVMDRLTNHQGYIHWKNTVLQFFTGIVAMVSGQSVGREGPAVHLGGGIASLLGRAMRLPNNSAPTLIACGVSAAIAASFNTPMAAVIFAIEVVVVEYSSISLLPVILSAVMGALINRAFFDKPLYEIVSHVGDIAIAELPLLILLGACISVAASAYIRLNILSLRISERLMPSISLRLVTAGVLTIVVAAAVPAVMGLGYDTINAAINVSVSLSLLLIIGLCKLVLTPVVVGLGMPGGVIGPMLIIGACFGAAFGIIVQELFGMGGQHIGLYAALGMAGMMAATLNAPLASLITVLELSYNPDLIFPAMIVIVVASIGTRYSFGMEGMFVEQLKYSRRELDFSPAKIALRRIGVNSILDRSFRISEKKLNYEEAKLALASNPKWLIFEDNTTMNALVAADLARFIENAPVDVLSLSEDIDLAKIPGRRFEMLPIHGTANLDETLQAMRETQRKALYVRSGTTALVSNIQGIVTIDAIETFYLPR